MFTPHTQLCGRSSLGVGVPCDDVLTKSALSRQSCAHLVPPLLSPPQPATFPPFPALLCTLLLLPSQGQSLSPSRRSRTFGDAHPSQPRWFAAAASAQSSRLSCSASWWPLCTQRHSPTLPRHLGTTRTPCLESRPATSPPECPSRMCRSSPSPTTTRTPHSPTLWTRKAFWGLEPSQP